MTPTEAPKVDDLKLEGLNTNLQDNLNKITEGVKTPENADQISKILTTCFQDDLKKLYETKEGKNFFTQLNSDITEALKKTDLAVEDKNALTDLQILIKPLTMTLVKTETTYTDDFTLDVATEGTWNKLDYNYKGEWQTTYIKETSTELNKDMYKNLPSKDKLLSYLNYPTKENIQKLQEFLYTKVPTDKKVAFEEANKIKNTKETDEKRRDGAFWTNTKSTFVDYLSAYLNDFTAFTPETKNNQDEITKAQLAADAIAQKGDNLETASIPSKTPQQLQEEQKDKNVANLQKEVGTKNGEDLVESDNFKLLPDKLQRKIQRVLKIETKDEDVEKEISDIDLQIANKTKKIEELTAENKKNQITINELTTKIKNHPWSDFRESRKERKKTRKPFQKSINENVSTIEWLNIDIDNLNYEKTFLVDKSDRLDNRFENKIVRINKVLASDKKILKDKITKYENDTDVKKTVDKRNSELAAIKAFEDDLLALQPADEEINIASNVPEKTKTITIDKSPTLTNTAIDIKDLAELPIDFSDIKDLWTWKKDGETYIFSPKEKITASERNNKPTAGKILFDLEQTYDLSYFNTDGNLSNSITEIRITPRKEVNNSVIAKEEKLTDKEVSTPLNTAMINEDLLISYNSDKIYPESTKTYKEIYDENYEKIKDNWNGKKITLTFPDENNTNITITWTIDYSPENSGVLKIVEENWGSREMAISSITADEIIVDRSAKKQKLTRTTDLNWAIIATLETVNENDNVAFN